MKKLLTTLSLTLVLFLSFFLGGCSKKTTAIKIGIPSDGTNLSRGIKLLETAGLIEVDPAAGYTPEMKDITKYIYNIEIVPTQAQTLSSLLDDYGACAINGAYAIAAGLIPSKDALIIEKQSESGDNPYVNIIAARSADKDNETYKKVVAAFQTQIVAEYMLTAYEEAYFPSFNYEEFTAEEGKETVKTVNAYKTALTADSATVVKVGVCGANNDHWKAVQYVLDQQSAGILIELQTFSAYSIPNEALNSGEIDLNAFQHKAYLNSDSTANGYSVESIGDTLIAPLSVYSHEYASLDALKAAAGLKN